MIASFSYKLRKRAAEGDAEGGVDGDEEGLLRAYVPNINYAMEITKDQLLEEVSCFECE
jgi:hypothetical protein